ncbi:hypothetical protein L9F63_007264, partial [Diploptera punctata]
AEGERSQRRTKCFTRPSTVAPAMVPKTGPNSRGVVIIVIISYTYVPNTYLRLFRKQVRTNFLTKLTKIPPNPVRIDTVIFPLEVTTHSHNKV